MSRVLVGCSAVVDVLLGGVSLAAGSETDCWTAIAIGGLSAASAIVFAVGSSVGKVFEQTN